MNKLTKRLLSLAVVVVMVMAMMPTVFAEEPAYTDWDGSASAIVNGAYLKLTDDLVVSERYAINGKTVIIDLNGKKITSTAAIQLLYVTGGAKVTIKNGTIEMPGLAADSSSVMGGIIQTSASAGNELHLDGVTITRTTNTDALSHAGILFARAVVTIKNSTLQVSAPSGDGTTKQEGGLIKVSSGTNLTIENSTLVGTRAKYGGCVFGTGSSNTVIKNSVLTGGTATSGRGGDLYTGGSATATVQEGCTIGEAYNNGNGITVAAGTVFYSNPASCNLSGLEAYCMDKTTGKTQYAVYAKLGDALKAAKATNTVSLMSDVTAGEVVVPANVTLNLYGKTLTATSVTSAFEGAQIKDEKSSKNAGGKLICDNVTVDADNEAAPIYYEGAYHFQKIKVASKQVENVYKFYLSDAAADIYLDDVWANGYGESGLKLQLTASYKLNGEEKTKTIDVSDDLIKAYVAGWDTKMFVLTITSDMSNIADLAFSVRVVTA